MVAGAERLRGLVAEAGELADPVGDLGPDLLRRLPRGAALVRVVAGAQDLGDRVVVDALAVDLAAEVVEGRLDARLELHDRAAQVGRDLVRHEGVVQDVELTAQQRVVGRRRRVARLAHGGEPERIGEELAAGELGRGAAFVGRRRRLGVRLPPRLGQLDLERAQLRFEVGDELGGGGVGHVRDPREAAESWPERDRIRARSAAASTARAWRASGSSTIWPSNAMAASPPATASS